MKRNFILLLALAAFSCKKPAPKSIENNELKSPDEIYGELFSAVQMAQVFPDGKTFVDCTPKFPVEEILKTYTENKDHPEFHLRAFVLQHFDLPESHGADFQSDSTKSTTQHIRSLWPVLTRQADSAKAGSSLLPLPHPYVVPGGRFREIYYWDSYFTMLGLQADSLPDMVQHMVDNFAFLIDRYGHIPNGNRTYYLSRSQPPFFAMMVQVLAEMKGLDVYVKYLPALEKEYDFWMKGADKLTAAAPAHRRVVLLENGAILNRYWDDRATPRPESYRQDVGTAEKSGRPGELVYRDLRAAAESGWDFSSRWLKNPNDLGSIHTTDMIPVDLNALLYNVEMTIARGYELDNDAAKAADFKKRAKQRAEALNELCWDDAAGMYFDYDFVAKSSPGRPSLATVYPLFFKIASQNQAEKIAQNIQSKFLQAGGVLTTPVATGQQWDAPNGWAPLQWLTYRGLKNYAQNDLANDLLKRWVTNCVRVYKNTGKMVEKYNVTDVSLEAGGGEYPVQDGFGWSNGVLQRLLKEEEALFFRN